MVCLKCSNATTTVSPPLPIVHIPELVRGAEHLLQTMSHVLGAQGSFNRSRYDGADTVQAAFIFFIYIVIF